MGIWWRIPAILHNWSSVFIDSNRAAHISPHHSCLHCSVGCHIATRSSCGCHIKTEAKQTATFRVDFVHPWDKSFQVFIEADGYDAAVWRGFLEAGGSDINTNSRLFLERERKRRGWEISGGEDYKNNVKNKTNKRKWWCETESEKRMQLRTKWTEPEKWRQWQKKRDCLGTGVCHWRW